MTTVLETLKELHELLCELADVRGQLQRAPLQLQGKQAEVARKEAAHAAAAEEAKRLKLTTHEREVTLKAGEQRVRDLKVKLNLAKTNKEYSAIADEIKNHESANGKLEEEILLMLTEQEEKNRRVDEAKTALDAARNELGEFKKVIDYRVEKLSARVGLLEAKLAELENQLEAQPRADYRRLVKLKGEQALAACDAGTCQACHTELTPQSRNDLLLSRVVFCKSCGAMLYPA